MQTRFDAIIIGAGPAGSTAAILLAQAGWSVALLEKQRFPRRKVCGECIAASNLPLLDALGIGDAFTAAAGPELRRVALWCGNQSINASLPAAAGPHPWGRALGREHLDALLLQRARACGAVVLQPCTALSLSGQAGDFRCDLLCSDPQEPATLRAPVAIAAHGSWEPLPAERGHRRTTRHAGDLLAFKANFVNVRLQAGVLPVVSFRGGYGGMVVADHGVTTLACCIRVDRLQACRQASPGSRAGGVVEAVLRQECAGVRNALTGAALAGRWLAAGPLRPGVRLSRTGTGAFLIGNAAGEAHPIIGEGISMAIQSAWLLCERLIPCRDVLGHGIGAQRRQREIHHRYAIEWHEQFRSRIRLAAWFAQAAMHPVLMSCLMPVMRRVGGVLTHGARWSGKVRCAEHRL
ncbi:MAG TPA: FAD-dependent oxidoreductase [Steroidobacteraceae bacterium]|jgi:2-polyprenyl-6-methoxyphenol hydroxylase-like FAD-dependent oxidoreductase|nr:FAD-dependent oxidoreductase [Steroidobacteraceae bacterium]